MAVSKRSDLKALLTAKKLDYPSVKEISGRALDIFQEKLQQIAEFVAEESVKNCRYSRLSAVEVERAFQRWHESQITGKLEIGFKRED